MGFSGSLTDLGLGDIFQNISASRMTGTLHVTGPRERCHIYFRDGEISMAAWPGEAQRPTHHASNRSLVSLVSGRDDESRAFIAEMADGIRRRIYEVFAWTHGEFDFVANPPSRDLFPEEQMLAALALDVEPILMEAARRTDEWSRVHQLIRDYRDVYRQAKAPVEPFPEAARAREVYDLIDGRRDVTAIIDTLSDDRFTVCRAMAELVQAGWIAAVSIEDRLGLSRAALKRGDHAMAIRIMIGVIDATPGAAHLHADLAALYIAVGDPASAARCHMNAACIYFDNDEPEEAAVALRTAADHVPEDVPLRTEIYTLLVSRNLHTQATAHGIELARLLEANDKLDRARTIYLELLQHNPSDPQLLEGRADCEVRLGQTRDAIRIYGTLAREAAKRDDVTRQRDLIERILDISPTHAEAIRMRADLDASVAARRRKTRTRTRTAAVWGLGIGLVAYLAAYEWMARSALAALQEKNASLVSQGRFSVALASFDVLRKAYPFSLARMECGILIEKLARGRLESVENVVRVPDATQTLDDLQRITGLAISGDVFDRTRRQISRIQAQLRIDELVATIDHPQSLAALRGYTDPIGLPLIETLLDHGDPRVRVAAMEPLVALRDYRAIPALLERLADREESVREGANKALQRLTDHRPDDTSYEHWIAWWRQDGEARFKDLAIGAR